MAQMVLCVRGTDPSVRGKAKRCSVFHCDPKIEGVAQMKELAFYAGRLRNITTWLAETNAALGSAVRIDAVLFDMELFFGCATEADCVALTHKSDLFYNLTKHLIPSGGDKPVTVIQYNRGTVTQ
jgi:hypothetical protein